MGLNYTINKPHTGMGSYMLDAISGTVAAGISANSPVYSIRWTDSSKLAVIMAIYMSMWDVTTGFTAGRGSFEIYFARSFSASDSSGTSCLPTGNIGKCRTSYATTLFGDMRISNTGALTAGTRTLDTNPLRRINFPVSATANAVMLATTEVLGLNVDGAHPIVLAQNEGIVIQTTMPATGTWTFNVGLRWYEAMTY